MTTCGVYLYNFIRHIREILMCRIYAAEERTEEHAIKMQSRNYIGIDRIKFQAKKLSP